MYSFRLNYRYGGRLNLQQKWAPGNFQGVKGGCPLHRANSSAGNYEPIVQKMWELRLLTTLQATGVYDRDSSIFTYTALNISHMAIFVPLK
jgi:hypothetical protein